MMRTFWHRFDELFGGLRLAGPVQEEGAAIGVVQEIGPRAGAQPGLNDIPEKAGILAT